jgi:aryl-alcohol dehydrogenase-like predicted oxidoreductase
VSELVSWPPEILGSASPIGLGLAAVGRPAYITIDRQAELGSDRSPESLRARAHELLDAAYEAGVRYVDAARSYGLAENFLADWLARRALAPGEVVVGSKWGYTYVGGWRMDAERQETQDLGLHTLNRQLEESLTILGSHLMLYQIHSASPENAVLSSSDVLDALRRLRERPMAIGLTVTGPHQAQVIDTAVELELFDTVQATWNLLEPSSGPALARAHAAGLTVIVKEALANGRLTDLGGQPALVHAAAARGLGADTLAISAALAQPWAGIVLSGAVTVETLHSNLAASPARWDAELAARAAGLVIPPDQYWRERSQRAWT